jgi:hypothetical protein
VANASPARPVHISYASLGASSGDTYPSTGSQPSDEDYDPNETITRISRQQGEWNLCAADAVANTQLTPNRPIADPVPALRSPDSVDRRDYFHSPHRRSLVPELGESSPPQATTAAVASTLDSPDDAARSGVLQRFPRPPLPAEHAASYATTTDGRSAIYVDALSTPFDDADEYGHGGRAGSISGGYDTQTQDSHYITADDESQTHFGSETGSNEFGHVY